MRAAVRGSAQQRSTRRSLARGPGANCSLLRLIALDKVLIAAYGCLWPVNVRTREAVQVLMPAPAESGSPPAGAADRVLGRQPPAAPNSSANFESVTPSSSLLLPTPHDSASAPTPSPAPAGPAETDGRGAGPGPLPASAGLAVISAGSVGQLAPPPPPTPSLPTSSPTRGSDQRRSTRRSLASRSRFLGETTGGGEALAPGASPPAQPPLVSCPWRRCRVAAAGPIFEFEAWLLPVAGSASPAQPRYL